MHFLLEISWQVLLVRTHTVRLTRKAMVMPMAYIVTAHNMEQLPFTILRYV